MKKERLRVRQLLAVLALSVVMPMEALAQHFTVNYRQQPVTAVINDLRQRTGYDFVYQKQVLDGVPAITCHCQGMSLNDLLDCIFHSIAGLDYEVSGKTIVLRAGKGRKIERPVQRLISGTIVDTQGEPMQWATIKVKGTSTGATTNENGQFQFYTDRQQETLQVSYLHHARRQQKPRRGRRHRLSGARQA